MAQGWVDDGFMHRIWISQGYLSTWQPGLVAQSVTQAVGRRLMDGFKGWAGAVATLLPEKGDRESVPYLSYHKATTPGRWRSQKTEARSIACKCSYKSPSAETWAQGRGFESREDREDFRLSFSTIIHAYSAAWWSSMSFIMWEIVFELNECLLHFHFRKYIKEKRYIKKKL